MNNDLSIWNNNAEFWDNFMGDESNDFHRQIVRPKTVELLNIQKEELVFDIACGNGNFSEFLASLGAKVVAFDFSEKMIDLAKKRRVKYKNSIEFNVCDATNYQCLMKLQKQQKFDKAVSNMAIMDIRKIEPLFQAVFDMLKDGGAFVFSCSHPCFSFEDGNYLDCYSYKGVAIEGQPELQNYYHRPIENLLNIAFSIGFKLDGFYEVPLNEKKTPVIMIARLKKII